MKRILGLAVLAAFLLPAALAPESAEAQEWHPDRYLYVNPRVAPRPVVVVRPAPPPSLVVVHRAPPPPVEVRVHTIHTPTPAPIVQPRSDSRFRVGVGAGALLRFGDAETEAIASYETRLGMIVAQAEFGFRLDPAPRFPGGDAFYTAGAGFRYRFLEDSNVHPHVGLGLETVFYNPVGAETARAFGLTAAAGLEMDV